MSGVSYWIEEDTQRIKAELENIVYRDNFESLFWDGVVKDNIKDFKIKIRKIDSKDWFEIDSVEDFKEAEQFIKS